MSGIGLHSLSFKNGKTRLTSCAKLITEIQYYDELDPGGTTKKKPRHEPRNMVLNQAQAITRLA